jgi:hypothetical protein
MVPFVPNLLVALFAFGVHCSTHGPVVRQWIQLVEVVTDDLVRGVAKRQLWAAAAGPRQALALVLAELPEGWSVALSDVQLKPEEIAVLKMQPGDVRELTK